MIYIVLFAYTVGTSYIFENSSLYKSRYNEVLKNHVDVQTIKRIFAYTIVVMPMILIHALRYGFGPDYTGTYRSIFYDVKNGFLLPKLEQGYFLLTKIMTFFTDNYVWELSIVSIITLTIVVIGIYQHAHMITASLALVFLSGFYFDSTTAVRQELACAIFLYAIPYLKQNKFWRFTLCIFIASLFHNSIWIIYPFYFLKKIKLKKWIFIILILGFWYARNIINNLVENYIYNDNVYDKYTYFLNEGRTDGLTYIIVFSVLLLIVLLGLKKQSIIYFDIYIVVFGFIISIFSSTVPYLYRFELYMLAALIYVVPDIIMNLKEKVKVFVVPLIYAVFSMYILWGAIIANWYGAIPYISVFQR